MPDTRLPEVFFEGPEEEHRRKLALSVREIIAGKTNNVISVTLEPNATKTEINRDRVNVDTVVLLTPKSASAAAALASGAVWTETTFGKATINHDSDAATDRTFGAAFIG